MIHLMCTGSSGTRDNHLLSSDCAVASACSSGTHFGTLAVKCSQASDFITANAAKQVVYRWFIKAFISFECVAQE